MNKAVLSPTKSPSFHPSQQQEQTYLVAQNYLEQFNHEDLLIITARNIQEAEKKAVAYWQNNDHLFLDHLKNKTLCEGFADHFYLIEDEDFNEDKFIENVKYFFGANALASSRYLDYFFDKTTINQEYGDKKKFDLFFDSAKKELGEYYKIFAGEVKTMLLDKIKKI